MNTDTKKKFDFGDALDDIDASEWMSNPHSGDDKPNLDQVREIAEEQGFTSREPKPTTAPKPKKEPEEQVLIRGPKSVIDDFKSFGKSQRPKWNHAYVLERAMEALKREIKNG